MSATTKIEGGAPIKASVAQTAVQPQQAPATTAKKSGAVQPFAADGKSSVNHAGLRTAVRGAETMAVRLDAPGVVTAQRYLSPYARVERIASMVPDVERSEWAEQQVIDLLFSAPRHEWDDVLRYMDRRTVYDSALILGSYKSLTNFLRDNLTGTERVEFRDWVDSARYGRTIPQPRWPRRLPYPRYPRYPRYPAPRYPRTPLPLPRYPRYPRNPGGGNRRPGGYPPPNRRPGGGNRRPGGNPPPNRRPGGGNRRPGGSTGPGRRPGGHTGGSRPLPRTPRNGGGNRSGGNRRPGSSRRN